MGDLFQRNKGKPLDFDLFNLCSRPFLYDEFNGNLFFVLVRGITDLNFFLYLNFCKPLGQIKRLNRFEVVVQFRLIENAFFPGQNIFFKLL